MVVAAFVCLLLALLMFVLEVFEANFPTDPFPLGFVFLTLSFLFAGPWPLPRRRR